MRSSSAAVDWAALGRVAIGFLLLAAVKLLGFAMDYQRRFFHQLLTDLDVPRFEPWVPYEELTDPNASQPVLDWLRCAVLHNRIVELGWLGHYNGTGRDPETRDRKTWWDEYGAEVEASGVDGRFTRELTAFLKSAHLSEEGLSFTYDLHGLASPYKMLDWLDNFDEGEYMLVLYEESWATDEGMGLVFDHFNNLVHYQPYEDTFQPELNWFALELALGVYLGQIEAGKFVALPQKEYGEREAEHNPWVMMPWEMYGGLEYAITTLERLIEAIWDEMPAEARTEHRQARHETRMISRTALQGLDRVPENSFLFQFLTRAPACPFDFIAPGIRCPTDETIAAILSEPPVPPSYAARNEDPLALPVLVFPSDERVEDDVGGGNFYSWYNATLTGVRGGLYMDGQGASSAYQDGVQLVTPFSIREHGWARTGDGQEIFDWPWHMYDETWADHNGDAYISLFQLGNNALQKRHHTNLHTVLDYWRDLVENSLWLVGPDGVEGGMEVFRMADTEEHWWRYCIQAHHY